MAIVRTKAILLRNYPFGESSEVAVLFTDALGKIRVSVKGARKMKSQMRARILPFSVSDVVVYVHPRKEIYNIKEAQLVKIFNRARDVQFQKTVSDVLNIVDSYVEEGPGGRKIFELLMNFLEILDKSDGRETVLKFSFILKFLEYVGHSPFLEKCLKCGRPSELDYFSPELGGTICKNCAVSQNEHYLIRINDGIRKTLLFMRDKPMTSVLNLSLNEGSIQRLIREYLEYHLGVSI